MKIFHANENFRWVLAAALTLVLLPVARAQSYTVTDIGLLGGGSSISPEGMNNEGTVVGTARNGSSVGHAFSYSNGTLTDLGVFSGNSSGAGSINDPGTIIGQYSNGSTTTPFVDVNGTLTALGSLGGGNTETSGINNTGTVIGTSYTSSSFLHGFKWSNGHMADLGTLGGNTSVASGINDLGVIVGVAQLGDDSTEHAFSYSATMTDIGTLGGTTSRAFAINNAGTIVGWALTAGGTEHAFSYSNGTMTDLGTLGGSSSMANAINSSGTIIGTSFTSGGSNDPFVYANGAMTDLNSLVNLPGVTLTNAIAINDRGQILASGSDSHGYLLGIIPTSGQPSFTLSLLTAPASNGAEASAINDLGVVAGLDNVGLTAEVWLSASPTFLPTQDSDGYGYAFGINNAGDVSGTSAISGDAVVWTRNGSSYAFTNLGGTQAAGNAINSSGYIAGYDNSQAVVWTWNGATHSESTIVAGVATAINSSGTAVGYDGSNQAFVSTWNGSTYSTPAILPAISGALGLAYGINDSGQVVGYSRSDSGLPATLWNLVGGTYSATNLGTLGGPNSIAYAINDSGSIVGNSTVSSDPSVQQHAFVYVNGVMYDLNSCVPGGTGGWLLSSADGINNQGQIAGTAGNGSITIPFVLSPLAGPTPTPTPTPSPTPTQAPSPTPSPTPTPTPSPTPTPTSAPTSAPSPSPTPSPTPTPTLQPATVLYVINQNNEGVGSVGSYALNGSVINAQLITGINTSGGLAASATNLFVASLGDSGIYEYNLDGTPLHSPPTKLISGLDWPSSISISGGELYVSETNRPQIDEYNLDGSAVAVPLIPRSTLTNPYGTAITGGQIYVADLGARRVGKYNAADGSVVNAALITGLDNPFGIATDGIHLYVSCNGHTASDGTINEYDLDGTPVAVPLVSGLAQPCGIAISGGELYVANLQSNSLGEYNLDGTVVNASLITGLSQPIAVVFAGTAPTPTPSPTATPTPTPTPTPSPTPTQTPSPTSSPTPTPTAVPTSTPTAVPTSTPTAAPNNNPVSYLGIGINGSYTTGVPMTVYVTAYDSSNNVVTGYSGNAAVYLDTFGLPTASFPNFSVNFANGYASFQVSYNAVAPSSFPITGYYIVVDAYLAHGTVSATTNYFNVYPPAPTPGPTPPPPPIGPAAYLTVTVPGAVNAGNILTCTVKAVDANGNLVTTYNDPGNLIVYVNQTNTFYPIGNVTPGNLVNGVATFTFYVGFQAGVESATETTYNLEVYNSSQTLVGWSGTLSISPPLPPPTPTPIVIAPSFNEGPASASVLVGWPASFGAVGIAGTPLPSLQWQVSADGGVTWANLSDGGGYSGSQSQILAIAAATVAMSGSEYRLVLTSSSGTTMTPAARLTVTAIPEGDAVVYDFTTLAGTPGQPGSADGNGSQAQFSSPFGIAVDASGVVYVADTGNNTVRRIASNGSVTTIAGAAGNAAYLDGQGTAARFDRPESICIDLQGNLFVADTDNYVIREISAAGSVSTLFGTPGTSGFENTNFFSYGMKTEEFVAPMGLALIPGTLFVSDGDGVRASFGENFYTAAGTVLGAGFSDGNPFSWQSLMSSPMGLVSGGQSNGEGSCYVADSGNSAIRFVSYFGLNDTPEWQVSTVLGGPSKVGDPLTTPAGIARDGAGDLFISDIGSQKIFELTAFGAVSTVAGSGHAGHTDGAGSLATFNGPYGIAVDGSGNLYVADTKNHTIRKGVPHVQFPYPTIVTQPASQAVAALGSATFSVVANATTPLSYQWTMNGSDIPGATSATYTIASAQVSDSGFYGVIVTNGTVFVASQPASLVVNPVTSIFSVSSTSLSLSASFGSTVVLSAIVSLGAAPALSVSPHAVTAQDYTYHWYLNGVPLVDGGGVSGSQTALLVLGDGSAEPGKYICLVSSASGSVLGPDLAVSVDASNQPSRLINLSCRGIAGPGSGNLIAGFVVGGSDGSVPVLARASGPALAEFGVAGVLSDPELQLFSTGSPASLLASNASWAGAADIAGPAANVGAFAWIDTSSKDSALFETLTPGSYTANISGASGDSGISLAEVYDATPPGGRTFDAPRLINLSARSRVGTGPGALIAGFVIGGSASTTVLIRASGPALKAFGLGGTLPDPQLQLFESNANGGSTIIESNVGWGGSAQISSISDTVGAFSWGTAPSADSAILVTLPPGAYTAEVSGASSDTGLALVEVYEVP